MLKASQLFSSYTPPYHLPQLFLLFSYLLHSGLNSKQKSTVLNGAHLWISYRKCGLRPEDYTCNPQHISWGTGSFQFSPQAVVGNPPSHLNETRRQELMFREATRCLRVPSAGSYTCTLMRDAHAIRAQQTPRPSNKTLQTMPPGNGAFLLPASSVMHLSGNLSSQNLRSLMPSKRHAAWEHPSKATFGSCVHTAQ